jgi:hypothetical protein
MVDVCFVITLNTCFATVCRLVRLPGGYIATGLTCAMSKILKVDKAEYEDSWLEGETITTMKGRMGQKLYEEGLASGDIIEKENSKGKLMCYTYKEKKQGELKTVLRQTTVDKTGAIDKKDSCYFVTFMTWQSRLFLCHHGNHTVMFRYVPYTTFFTMYCPDRTW